VEDAKLWDDFLIDDEIVKAVNDSRWRDVLTRPFDKLELVRKIVWDAPESGGNISEHTFELLWSNITSALNLIHKKCAARAQNNEDPVRVLIGTGLCAKKITNLPYREGAVKRSQAGKTKIPDFAGYLYNPKQGGNCYSRDVTEKVENRIPGDAKLYRKMRRSMFPPDGSEFVSTNVGEITKVLTQIHDYMDRHEARYGYLVNDEELIFFRRRGTGWGHVDISPAIKHDIDGINPECKIPTSKLILFYFHLIVANDESQYKLPSCRPLIERRHIPPRSARGDTGLLVTGPFYKETK
jgi:hypothetical protein